MNPRRGFAKLLPQLVLATLLTGGTGLRAQVVIDKTTPLGKEQLAGLRREISRRVALLENTNGDAEARSLLGDVFRRHEELRRTSAKMAAYRAEFQELVRSDDDFREIEACRTRYNNLYERALRDGLVVPEQYAQAIFRNENTTPSGIKLYGIPFEALVFGEKAKAAGKLREQLNGVNGEGGVHWQWADAATRLSERFKPGSPSHRKLQDLHERVDRDHRRYEKEHAAFLAAWRRGCEFFYSRAAEDALGMPRALYLPVDVDNGLVCRVRSVPGLDLLDQMPPPVDAEEFDLSYFRLHPPNGFPLCRDGHQLLDMALEEEYRLLNAELGILKFVFYYKTYYWYQTAHGMLDFWTGGLVKSIQDAKSPADYAAGIFFPAKLAWNLTGGVVTGLADSVQTIIQERSKAMYEPETRNLMIKNVNARVPGLGTWLYGKEERADRQRQMVKLIDDMMASTKHLVNEEELKALIDKPPTVPSFRYGDYKDKLEALKTVRKHREHVRVAQFRFEQLDRQFNEDWTEGMAWFDLATAGTGRFNQAAKKALARTKVGEGLSARLGKLSDAYGKVRLRYQETKLGRASKRVSDKLNANVSKFEEVLEKDVADYFRKDAATPDLKTGGFHPADSKLGGEPTKADSDPNATVVDADATVGAESVGLAQKASELTRASDAALIGPPPYSPVRDFDLPHTNAYLTPGGSIMHIYKDLLAKGGQGDVYKGYFEGKKVAIKRARNDQVSIDALMSDWKGSRELGTDALQCRKIQIDVGPPKGTEWVLIKPLLSEKQLLTNMLEEVEAGVAQFGKAHQQAAVDLLDRTVEQGKVYVDLQKGNVHFNRTDNGVAMQYTEGAHTVTADMLNKNLALLKPDAKTVESFFGRPFAELEKGLLPAEVLKVQLACMFLEQGTHNFAIKTIVTTLTGFTITNLFGKEGQGRMRHGSRAQLQRLFPLARMKKLLKKHGVPPSQIKEFMAGTGMTEFYNKSLAQQMCEVGNSLAPAAFGIWRDSSLRDGGVGTSLLEGEKEETGK